MYFLLSTYIFDESEDIELDDIPNYSNSVNVSCHLIRGSAAPPRRAHPTAHAPERCCPLIGTVWVGNALADDNLAQLILNVWKIRIEFPDKYRFMSWMGDAFYKVYSISKAVKAYGEGQAEEIVTTQITNASQAIVLQRILAKVRTSIGDIYSLLCQLDEQ